MLIEYWENNNIFSEEEIDEIVRIGSELTTEFYNDENEVIGFTRKCDVGWLNKDNNTTWIYERIWNTADYLNKLVGFNLALEISTPQYLTYNADHYCDWHLDIGKNVSRKLSVIIQLSDDSEYIGGNLELMTGPVPLVPSREKGMVIIFPSYILHRITKIIHGTRRSLSTWIPGPDFL